MTGPSAHASDRLAPKGSLVGALREAAANRAGALAIDDGAMAYTYGALHDRVRRLAGSIAARVAPGARVGLLSERSSDATAAFHAILAAGAVAVPLAPGSPGARARATLDDCDAQLVLCDAAYAGHAEPLGRTTLRIDGALEAIVSTALEGRADDRRADDRHADDGRADEGSSRTAATHEDRAIEGTGHLAYVLYTSGSTGAPKGVSWDHGPAAAFPAWCVERFGLRADDRVAAVAPLSFDLATFDLFAAPLAGAAVLVPPREALLFPRSLARWIAERRPTVMYAVPTHYVRLCEAGADLSSLRAVLFAGEVFASPGLHALSTRAPGAVLENLYGPTETNVCTSHRVRAIAPGDAPVPIGRALPHLSAHIAEPDGDGVGELVIEGDAVMAGYYGALGRSRRHATGDYVSDGPDGFVFHGRRDRMVKVRGHRVELGEVEHAASLFADVHECAVVPHGEALRLYYVASEDLTRSLRAHCATRLPAYMVPAELVRLDALPRTATGKVALAELEPGRR